MSDGTRFHMRGTTDALRQSRVRRAIRTWVMANTQSAPFALHLSCASSASRKAAKTSASPNLCYPARDSTLSRELSISTAFGGESTPDSQLCIWTHQPKTPNGRAWLPPQTNCTGTCSSSVNVKEDISLSSLFATNTSMMPSPSRSLIRSAPTVPPMSVTIVVSYARAGPGREKASIPGDYRPPPGECASPLRCWREDKSRKQTRGLQRQE